MVQFCFESFCAEEEKLKVYKLQHVDRKTFHDFCFSIFEFVKDPFFSSELTPVSWCHHSRMLWRKVPHKLKPKKKRSSSSLKKLNEAVLHRFSKFLINFAPMKQTPSKTTSKLIQIMYENSFSKCNKNQLNDFRPF